MDYLGGLFWFLLVIFFIIKIYNSYTDLKKRKVDKRSFLLEMVIYLLFFKFGMEMKIFYQFILFYVFLIFLVNKKIISGGDSLIILDFLYLSKLNLGVYILFAFLLAMFLITLYKKIINKENMEFPLYPIYTTFLLILVIINQVV